MSLLFSQSKDGLAKPPRHRYEYADLEETKARLAVSTAGASSADSELSLRRLSVLAVKLMPTSEQISCEEQTAFVALHSFVKSPSVPL